MKTEVALFGGVEQAKAAIWALEKSGVSRSEISAVAPDAYQRYQLYGTTPANSGAVVTDTKSAMAHGAETGAVVGAGVAAALGAGALIPAFGAFTALGWLLITASGLGAGTLVGSLAGALSQAGVPHEQAATLQEAIQRGSILVAVRTPDEGAASVRHLLRRHGGRAVDERNVEREEHVPRGDADLTRRQAEEEAVLDADFMAHLKSVEPGADYEELRPGYHFGYAVASDPDYAAQDWDQIAARAKLDWTERMIVPWDRVAGAVRYGWERARTNTAPTRSSDYVVDGAASIR